MNADNEILQILEVYTEASKIPENTMLSGKKKTKKKTSYFLELFNYRSITYGNNYTYTYKRKNIL